MDTRSMCGIENPRSGFSIHSVFTKKDVDRIRKHFEGKKPSRGRDAIR